jgi:hypothetical protein
VSDEPAELTGHADIDHAIKLFKLTKSELAQVLASRPGDRAAAVAIAQRVTRARREQVIEIRWTR